MPTGEHTYVKENSKSGLKIYFCPIKRKHSSRMRTDRFSECGRGVVVLCWGVVAVFRGGAVLGRVLSGGCFTQRNP